MSWLLGRWRDLSGSSARVVAFDIARGIAVLGMFAVHAGSYGWAFDWADPGSWNALVWGNSSALFAVLAGVSITLLSGRGELLDGLSLVQARVRILTRAVLIFAVGGVLASLGTSVLVIVEFYAFYFVMSLPFLRMRARWLAVTAAAWMLLMPIALHYLVAWVQSGQGQPTGFVEYMVTGFYPAMSWFGYTLVGMTLGRLPYRKLLVQVLTLATGIVMVFVSWLTMFVASIVSGASVEMGARTFWDLVAYAGKVSLATDEGLLWLLTMEGHSGTPLDFMKSSGIALIVIGILLLIGRYVRFVLFPIAAIGSMSLSAYTLHVLGFLIWPDALHDFEGWLWLAGVIGGFSLVWRFFFRKGPLEWGMTKLSTAAAAVTYREPVRVDAVETPRPQEVSTR